MNKLIWEPSQAPFYVDWDFGNGSDWLKIVSEMSGPNQVTQNALVAEAHALSKKANTHAADLVSYNMAIVSMSDGPQHVPLNGLLNDTMLDLMLYQRQYATPTMNVFYEELQLPGAAAALGHSGISFDQEWSYVKQNVAALYAKGIPILAGTDATTPYAGESVPFDSSLHDELWHLYEAGLPTPDILRVATITPALAHQMIDRGAIKPGMRADLLLVQPDADPIAAINDNLKISRVWNGDLEFKNVKV
jgi:hypothetical protein